jgi:cysteine desulfurase / selenocysteine lyase
VEQIQVHEVTLKARLRERLGTIAGVTVHSPAAPDGTGIVLISTPAMTAAGLAARLDRDHGVLTRAGLHCAPETHALLGTDRAGAVRLSVGWATTVADVERAADAVAAVCRGR